MESRGELLFPPWGAWGGPCRGDMEQKPRWGGSHAGAVSSLGRCPGRCPGHQGDRVAEPRGGGRRRGMEAVGQPPENFRFCLKGGGKPSSALGWE